MLFFEIWYLICCQPNHSTIPKMALLTSNNSNFCTMEFNEKNAEQNENIVIKDPQKVCRCCLDPNYLASIVEIQYGELELSTIISELFSTEISCDDNMPKNICEKCLSEIIQFYELTEKFKKSESLLRMMVKSCPEAEPEPAIDDKNNNKGKAKRRTFPRVFHCRVCDKKYTKSGIKLHICFKKSSQRMCEYCGKIFMSQTQYTRHKRIHTGEKRFVCETCGKKFTTRHQYKVHSKTHTRELPSYTCEICEEKFSSKLKLHLHLQLHGTKELYRCAQCARTFLYHQAYMNHLKKIHEGIDTIETKIPRKFICDICNKTFANNSTLKVHVLTHGGPKFHCSKCGKLLMSRTGLVQHLRIHTEEKNYVCQYCGKCFAYNAALKSHLRHHTGDKPYICKICKEGFPHCSNLQRHMRQHTGEKPYLCYFCGKRFAQSGNLAVHKRRHMNDTPFECKLCNEKFYETSTLKRHQIRAH